MAGLHTGDVRREPCGASGCRIINDNQVCTPTGRVRRGAPAGGGAAYRPEFMAAFGAAPAMIDAWVLARGRATLTSMATGWLLVRSSSVSRMRFDVCR